jgi:hypothetical protein
MGEFGLEGVYFGAALNSGRKEGKKKFLKKPPKKPPFPS